MEGHHVRLVLPILLVIIIVLSVLILGGLASRFPDGFEWAVFVFAGIPEPSTWFHGLWSFLGEGSVAEFFTGVMGVVLVLALSYVLFLAMSRRDGASSESS